LRHGVDVLSFTSAKQMHPHGLQLKRAATYLLVGCCKFMFVTSPCTYFDMAPL